MTAANREEWLNQAVGLLRREFDNDLFAIFGDDGAEHLDKVQVSIGWPSTRGVNGKVIGECWNSLSTEDGVHQIFISPILDSPLRILDVLLHELIHAADDGQSHHKGKFVKAVRAVGLEGKPTATIAGDDLKVRLSGLHAELGELPHSGLKPKARLVPVQKTYMLKFECSGNAEGKGATTFNVRTTQKQIDEFGFPLCPCHEHPMVQEVKE